MANNELFGNSEQLDDTISRQWLMECVNEGWIKFDTEEDENKFIHLVRDIAPTAQPSATDTNVVTTDTISRASAIETVRRAKSIGQAHRMLVQLPSAQQWIPCKERLPEKDGEYLVTMLYFGEKTVVVDRFSHYETDDEDNGKPLWVYGYDNVIAWMPRPEPWKGEQNGTPRAVLPKKSLR